MKTAICDECGGLFIVGLWPGESRYCFAHPFGPMFVCKGCYPEHWEFHHADDWARFRVRYEMFKELGFVQ